jgi:hypothetical protein
MADAFMWSGHLSLPPSRARCTCPHPRTKTTHGKLEIASGISATPGPSQLGRLASWTGHPSTHPGTKDTVPGWLHAQGGAGLGWLAEPNIFLRICTHTQIITISSDPCPPMLFKLCPCIQKLCNVYHPPTPSLGWIIQIKGRSLSLVSARSASWLEYSLHPRSLTPIWSWMQGCTKPMPTHE